MVFKIRLNRDLPHRLRTYILSVSSSSESDSGASNIQLQDHFIDLVAPR
jgi:hypothetical protein